MNYKFEYNGNPEYVTLHTTVRLIEGNFVTSTCLSTVASEMELISLMDHVTGATEASLRPYSVTLKRGATFTRDVVLKNALDVLTMWLRVHNLMEDGEELTQLPTIRTDIRMVQCWDCAEEQRREAESSMRDFETLEWD